MFPLRCLFASLLTILGVATSFATIQAQDVRWNASPEEWKWVVATEIPGATHGTLESASMQRKVGYNVYLPPGYESSPDRRYPVVYWLHGASGSEMSARECSFIPGMIARKELGDVIYVFPNGGHFSKYRDWDEGNVKAETLLIKELIPHIDATYRTIASREGRAIAGWSMGGDGALRFATKYPGLFCAAASVSAAVDWNAPEDDSIFVNAKRNAEQLRGKTTFLMVVGEEDRLRDAHRKLLPQLDSIEIEYEYESLPGVGHDLGAMLRKYGERIAKTLEKSYSPAR